MTLARSVLAPVVGSALVLGSMAADEPSTIYECTDANGNVVYQDDPCIEAAPVAPKPAPRPAEPAPPGRPVDVRWASPQKTLQTFVGAVKAGNRALVLSCLTSSALAELGPDAAALPLETLRETVGSFTGYVAEGDLGPFWSIRALRKGMRPKWIFFERTGTGEWKIAAI